MSSTALFVHGATLERGDDLVANTPVYTDIPNITQVALPIGFDVEKVDVTVHSSPDYTREFIPGLVTREDVAFTLKYSHQEAQHVVLQNPANARTKVAWRITLPIAVSGNSSGATFEWDGWCTFTNPTAGSTDLEASGTIVVASTVAFTAEA